MLTSYCRRTLAIDGTRISFIIYEHINDLELFNSRIGGLLPDSAAVTIIVRLH